MKSLISTTLLIFFIIISLNAQIDVRKDEIKNAPVFKPTIYDSTENIKYLYINKTDPSYNNLTINEIVKRNDEEFKKYIGQTIFFVPYSDENRLNSTMSYFYYLNKKKIEKSYLIEKENNTKIMTRQQIYPTQYKQGNIPKNMTYEQYIVKDTISSYVETNIYLPQNKKLSPTSNQRGHSYSSNECEENSKSHFYTPLNQIIGGYYKIIDIKFDEDYSQYSKIKFIICDKNNDTLYFYRTRMNLFESTKDICIVGYFEYLNRNYQSKKYVYAPNFNDNMKQLITKNYDSNGNPIVPDINTGEQIAITPNSIWIIQKTQYLKIESELYYQLFFILLNDKGNEIKIPISELDKCFIDNNEYLKELNFRKLAKLEQDKIRNETIKNNNLKAEKYKQDILQKYGTYYGNLILKHQVVLGMSKEMCKLSWGSPRDINTTIVTGLTHEQWVYSLKVYLYFENGNLTAIQK